MPISSALKSPVASAPASLLQGTHWLVVDDDPLGRSVCARSMALLGATTDIAADGIEALARLAARRYVGVVSDGEMPQLDGYQLASAIRQEEAAARLPPLVLILLTSAHGQEVRARAAGFDMAMTKPIYLDNLRETFDALLEAEPHIFARRPAAANDFQSGASGDLPRPEAASPT